MKKILGLDLGSSSLGWSLKEGENITTGVVTFDSGMMKGKSGYTSPTKDRREARSKRRLLQARKYRKWALLKVLIENNYAPLLREELELWCKYEKGKQQKFPDSQMFKKWLACDFSYESGINYINPYELRIATLNSHVSKHEFGRALYHLVQRRGYKNIGESDIDELNVEEAQKDSETKKQLERREKEGFALALHNNDGIIAKALKKEFLDKGKRARNQYPLRKEYRHELEQLCKTQGFDITRNEMGIYKDEFVHSLWKAIIWQRPLRSQKGNIGRCTLEKDRLRCPVSHPLFEIFRSWQFINTIKYLDLDETMKFLPQDLRSDLFSNFFLKRDKNVKFTEIKNYLNKKFNTKCKYNYKEDHTASTMPVCKGLIQIFGELAEKQIKELYNYNIGNAPKIIKDKYSIFDLWHALYNFDESYLNKFATQKIEVKNKNKKNGKAYNPFAELKKLIASSFSDLSIKSISKIIPFLENGFLYNEAVLIAKIPELLGENWQNKKDQIFTVIKQANEEYRSHKAVTLICNNIIDLWKGQHANDKYFENNSSHQLTENDITNVREGCIRHYGEKTWEKLPDKEKNDILESVTSMYKSFLADTKHRYCAIPTLDSILRSEFQRQGIDIDVSQLYHHSKQQNKYKAPITDKSTGKDILSIPLIDSIKNPMFNKALTILRKFINELIVNGSIDNDTEVVIELARELNDNNRRIAIERYQRYREKIRESIKKVMEELKENENSDVNINEGILRFELWSEQIPDKVEDENGKTVFVSELILKEKDASKRYELWREQKGICMYTGKPIQFSYLFSNEIDIEHTIPRSLLPDNTMANQTVCYAWYNRDKKKKLLPTQCANYTDDVEGWGSPIERGLKHWVELREHFFKLYEDKKKAKGSEDEAVKNKRIQDKHYYKMHLDYWRDKIERFTCEEVKESWARRQLTDTQMISKYAREFLCTYFNKVKVQKASVNVEFRKIFGFQEADEIKNRDKHTHHAIDAAVLTLIPLNSSYRDKLLKTMYEWKEQRRGQFISKPFDDFSAEEFIKQIENTLIIVNYHKDSLFKKTYKIVRKRGRIVYLKNKNGEYIKDKDGNRIIQKAKGDSIRTTLYKQTFLAKLRNVERDEAGNPLLDKNGNWIFKKGKEEFFYAEKVSIEEAKKYIDDIVDEVIKQLVKAQKKNPDVKDHQGNIIRHVRIKTNAGKIVKQRLNYLSKHNYKNNYYSAAGSIPYAAYLQNRDGENIERVMIPIASADIGKFKNKYGTVDIVKYINLSYPEYSHYSDKKLLKVGQKVFVLKDNNEHDKKHDKDFQIKRLYNISQFEYQGKKIILNYHLEARQRSEIDKMIKVTKSNVLKPYEEKYGISEIKPDERITNVEERNKDYEKRFY
ncbi:MAG: hypothetical protein K8I03_10820, partial [Ignavibacteria bacterium]|nr:hypothetical protein [Ignavibacteria bacterium]